MNKSISRLYLVGTVLTNKPKLERKRKKQLEIHAQSYRHGLFLPDRTLERLQDWSQLLLGAQKMAYKEVAVRQESGHVSRELSTEHLSPLALPLSCVDCRLQYWLPAEATKTAL